MRTIRFRAKTFHEKGVSSGRWVYGWIVGKSFLVDMHGSEKEIFPDTTGQYIGEMDIKGKDIYEGDILVIDNLMVVIEYKNTGFVGVYKGIQEKLWAPLKDSFNQWEIIGNTVDNSEILPDNQNKN